MASNVMSMIASLNLRKDKEELLVFLIKTPEDFANFVENFLNKSELIFAIMDFRVHKVTQRGMQFREFEALYAQHSHNALEELFQLPCETLVTSVIINKIENGNLSLPTIFDTFMNDKDMNIARFAQGRRR